MAESLSGGGGGAGRGGRGGRTQRSRTPRPSVHSFNRYFVSLSSTPSRGGWPPPQGGGWTSGASAARLGEGGRNSRRQGCLGRRAGPGTGLSPRSPPLSAPLAPCFHPPATLLWDRLAQQDERTPSPAPRSSPSPAGGRTGVAPRNFPGRDGPRALPPSSPSPLPRTREGLPPIAVVRTSVGRSPPHPPKVAKTSPNKVAPSKMAKQCVPPSLRLPVRLPPAAPPAAPPPPRGGPGRPRTWDQPGIPAWDGYRG